MQEQRIGSGERDAIVVGGGFGALVCATVLGRSGLAVTLVDDRPALGGTHRTEYPFAKAPRLGAHPGEHSAGLVPPGLGPALGVALPRGAGVTARFVPALGGHTWTGGDRRDGLSPADAAALAALEAELDALADDLGPAWTTEAGTIEEVAERHVRPALRAAFRQLCRDSFASYAARFGIASGLLRAALAVEALAGTSAALDAPGGGAALLVRHAARRNAPGLATLGRALAQAVEAAGVEVLSGAKVGAIAVGGNTVSGVVLEDGRELRAGAVVSGADPLRLRALVGAEHFPADYQRRIEALVRPASVAKLELALAHLPRFAALPEEVGQHAATAYLLPLAGGEDDAVRAVVRAQAEVAAGHLPVDPPLVGTFPTVLEPSLRDPEGRHGMSVLVPWVPYDLAGTTWAAEEERFTERLLDGIERLAPGTRAAIVDAVLLSPKRLEAHFGVTRGLLAQAEDTALFADRLGPSTPVNGLYTCARAAGPAAGVVGAAGLLAARRVLADLELALERTELGPRG